MTGEAGRARTADDVSDADWWRGAVVYQVYPRSFADSNGDGVGDLPGVTARLDHLVELGVDAVWLSPFYRSPQHDGGYDVADYRDVDPLFGTLGDCDKLIAAAHDRDIRVIVDLVPNHSSDEHPWFVEALADRPGGPARARYVFLDGNGPAGALPPNDWLSQFGGPAWTRVPDGQWYLHLFDAHQPDFDWNNVDVVDEFESILRFWLDRGVDGFRVDVAHGLVKAPGLPNWQPIAPGSRVGAPMWDQDAVHDVYRRWRALLDTYPGRRILVAEAWVTPAERLAQYVRPDEMHQAFNFDYLTTPWEAEALRIVIDRTRAATGAVGAAPTWVLSNHDVIRHATRLAYPHPIGYHAGIGAADPHPDVATGLRRGRAATLLMLALPGSAYIYQGEELGLPEDVWLPDSARQDPTWPRSGYTVRGRDGCRVPLPWDAAAPSYGFGPMAASWLPQPAIWAEYALSAQRGVSGSTYEMYRRALALRRSYGLGDADMAWIDAPGPDVLAFRAGDIIVLTNFGTHPVEIATQVRPAIARGAEPVLASADISRGALPPDATVWLAATTEPA